MLSYDKYIWRRWIWVIGLMLLNESLWFRQKMEYIRKGDVLLNLGPSIKEFREGLRPHIYENLFLPLEEKTVQVYHVDMKLGNGIDLVGDMTDLESLKRLKALKPAGLICSILLEHLEDRGRFSKAVVELLSSSGYIFASCPRDYPCHSSPIVTMFRPGVMELAAEFPGMLVVEGEIVACGTWKEKVSYDCNVNYPRCYHRKAKRIIRLLVPFYKSRGWLERITRKNKINPNQKLSVTCVVLQRFDTRYSDNLQPT